MLWLVFGKPYLKNEDILGLERYAGRKTGLWEWNYCCYTENEHYNAGGRVVRAAVEDNEVEMGPVKANINKILGRCLTTISFQSQQSWY